MRDFEHVFRVIHQEFRDLFEKLKQTGKFV